MPTKQDLKMLQALPLKIKTLKTKYRIKEWVDFFGVDGVYVSFSGGKDSAVLLDLVRQDYPTVEAVFADTGLEYPEIREFVKGYDNVTWVRPKMRFDEVIKKYGYPVISKEISKILHYRDSNWAKQRLEGKNSKGRISPFKSRFIKYAKLLEADFLISNKCCYYTKELPMDNLKKSAIIGTMAEESEQRRSGWLKVGCNAFDLKRPRSAPLSFWTNQDILEYIKTHNLKIATVYGDVVDKQTRKDGQFCMNGCERFCTTGAERTGCMFCLFGMHLEKGETRLQRLHKTHPKVYDYCMNGGEFVNGLWQPNSKGLGLKYVCDKTNEVMGKELLRY